MFRSEHESRPITFLSDRDCGFDCADELGPELRFLRDERCSHADEIAAEIQRRRASSERTEKAIASFSRAMGPIGLIFCLSALGWMVAQSLGGTSGQEKGVSRAIQHELHGQRSEQHA